MSENTTTLSQIEVNVLVSAMRDMWDRLEILGQIPAGKDMSDGFGCVANGIGRKEMATALEKLSVNWDLSPLN